MHRLQESEGFKQWLHLKGQTRDEGLLDQMMADLVSAVLDQEGACVGQGPNNGEMSEADQTATACMLLLSAMVPWSGKP